MESINLGGIRLKFDRERTSNLLADNSNRDWCQCDGCTNIRVNCQRLIPREAVELLRNIEINAAEAFHREHGRDIKKRPGWYWAVSYWPIYGKVDDAQGAVELAPGIRLEVGPSFSQEEYAYQVLEHTGLTDQPDLLFVKLRAQIPNIISELGELRYEDHCLPCRKCHCTWRWKAYLKRGSRLPEWYGIPELASAFRQPRSRVLVAICLDCGDLTYEVVPDKPPFRRTSEASKAETEKFSRLFKKANKKYQD